MPYEWPSETVEDRRRKNAELSNRQVRYVSVGERVLMPIGYSEAACHLRVAGVTMLVELKQDQFGTFMVQLWEPAEEPGQTPSRFSFSITAGEAGLYHDDHGWYHHA